VSGCRGFSCRASLMPGCNKRRDLSANGRKRSGAVAAQLEQRESVTSSIRADANLCSHTAAQARFNGYNPALCCVARAFVRARTVELIAETTPMPMYDYQCASCGHQLEAIQKISAEPLVDCPACQAPELKKMLSMPGFRLSGTGWYETDFKTGSKKNLAGGDKAD
jgi:putative FmdB family regulatory protein